MNLSDFAVLINTVLLGTILFFILKMLRQLGTIISRNITLFQEYDALRGQLTTTYSTRNKLDKD